MAPVVQGRASGRTTGNATSHPITLPSGIVVGQLLVVFFANDGNSATTAVSSGTNWVKLGQAADTGGAVTGSVFYKYADGSDSLTMGTGAFNEESSHITMRVSDAQNAPTGSSANSGVSASANSNPPNHAPAAGSKDYLWVVFRAGDSTVVATAAPANYSTLQTQAANTTGGASSNTAERSLTAASEDPGAFTSASENWVAWTIAIEPAPTGLLVLQRHPPSFRR